ncbi:hypothetical protein MUP51_04700, partial [Candidatus Bathyarchaeota archaeon]|nr:hypothetical protein [Candidatus Bathyarchaeota archaeon]
WETEARNGEKYMVELTDEGWYTLSLWSPVCFSAGTLEKSGSMILEDNHTLPYPDVIDSWIEFRVTRDGEPLLLLLKYN